MVAGEGRRSAVLVPRHPTAAPTEWPGGPTAVDAPRAYSRRQKENSASNEEEQPVLLRGETHASCRTLAYGFTRARSLPTCFSLRMKMAFCTADTSSTDEGSQPFSSPITARTIFRTFHCGDHHVVQSIHTKKRHIAI